MQDPELFSSPSLAISMSSAMADPRSSMREFVGWRKFDHRSRTRKDSRTEALSRQCRSKATMSCCTSRVSNVSFNKLRFAIR